MDKQVIDGRSVLSRSWSSGLRGWLLRAVETSLLLPVFALLFLVVIWSATLHFIDVARQGSQQATDVLSRELVETYEAQVLRSLREIDQTLKFIKYAYENGDAKAALTALAEKDLLLPELLFVTTITDHLGNILASTRTTADLAKVDSAYFLNPLHSDSLWVSRAQPGSGPSEAHQQFSRRINDARGDLAGVVTISVAPGYFMSGYESSKFGAKGSLGILGSDGVFLANRTGNAVSVGKGVNYASVVGADQLGSEGAVVSPSWDGVRRYTRARKLYDFPLTVLVGLSEEEQLASFHGRSQTYFWWAGTGSALLLLIVAALWRLRWQLDTSRRNEAVQRELTEQNLRIAAAAFDSQEAMIIADSRKIILQVNRAFTVDTGHLAIDLVGQTPRLLQSGQHDDSFYRAMWRTINQDGVWQGEIWQLHSDGVAYLKWLTISAVKDDHGVVTNYVSSHYDITARKLAEKKIHKLAFFDQLTELPNRTLLQDRLKQTMAASVRDDRCCALLFIDLDNFKTLNDTLGHDTGDMLLQQVAQRLLSCVRAEDTVARLGGDEFVVLITRLDHNLTDAASQMAIVSSHVLSTLDTVYPLKEVLYRSTASVGVALFDGHPMSTDDLMKQADLAMYRAKEEGRNRVRFFDPIMESSVRNRIALETDLRQAIEEKQFFLVYQPQVTYDVQVVGSEALVRWLHPQRGMVSPAEFIPLAEETGLILPLGHWVLETACIQLACWALQPDMAHLTLAVNVSARQFQQTDFCDQVQDVLTRTGANPHRLKLELTESMLVSGVDQVIEKMFTLKSRGIAFSLDDFGTGFSSLSYLKLLPLDQLKIDQAFVRDVASNPNDAAIAQTIIGLAKALRLGVIAEGVETPVQRDFLASAGCHTYQGYFFSRPLPLGDFEAFAQARPQII